MLVPMIAALPPSSEASAPTLTLAGAWQVRLSPGSVKIGKAVVRIAKPVTLTISPASRLVVADEKFDSLPPYDATAAPWTRGARLKAVITSETTGPDLLKADTLVFKSGPGSTGGRLRVGTEIGLEPRWGTFGRMEALPAGTPVWVDYEVGLLRIDSIVVDAKGAVSVLKGQPHNATPKPPVVGAGEAVVANVWVPGGCEALTAENLYPIIEAGYPEPVRKGAPPAAKLLPRTWAKLRAGEPVSVLAWGDSVTAGGEASSVETRYQNVFVQMLGRKYPKSRITLTTAGWGGRNSDSFLQAPTDSEFNFEKAVIQRRPDLIVMEFVNDGWMNPQQVEEKYTYLEQRFKEIGADWIIITPHYVWQDWMGSKTIRIEEDPRPYVAGVRAFCAKHKVAIADTSLRWGHLLKEGIPYITLEVNSLNHHDDRGHAMFAKALMESF
jgi:hypothetical protein